MVMRLLQAPQIGDQVPELVVGHRVFEPRGHDGDGTGLHLLDVGSGEADVFLVRGAEENGVRGSAGDEAGDGLAAAGLDDVGLVPRPTLAPGIEDRFQRSRWLCRSPTLVKSGPILPPLSPTR